MFEPITCPQERYKLLNRMTNILTEFSKALLFLPPSSCQASQAEDVGSDQVEEGVGPWDLTPCTGWRDGLIVGL